MNFTPEFSGEVQNEILFYRAEEYKTIKIGIVDEHSVSIIIRILPKIGFKPFQPGIDERPLFE